MRTTPARLPTAYRIVLSVLTLSACGESAVPRQSAATDTLDYAAVSATNLAGHILFEGTALARPSQLALVGTQFAVANGGADSLLLVIDRVQHSQHAYGLVRVGDGPDEARSIVNMQSWPPGRSDPAALWLYDLTLRRATALDLPLVPGGTRTETTIGIRTEGLTTSLQWLTDSLAVATGFYHDGRLAFLNRHGDVIAYRGPLPPNAQGLPVPVLQHAYQGYLAVRPDRRRIAVVTRHAGQLEIYDRGGNLVVRKDGPFAFTPRVTVARGVDGPIMSSGGDLRFGYVAVAASQRYLYALFSGRTRRGYPNEAIYGEYVHRFNWDGEFVDAMHLDEAAIAITVDSQDDSLYAIIHSPRPMIVGYDIPGPPRQAEASP